MKATPLRRHRGERRSASAGREGQVEGCVRGRKCAGGDRGLRAASTAGACPTCRRRRPRRSTTSPTPRRRGRSWSRSTRPRWCNGSRRFSSRQTRAAIDGVRGSRPRPRSPCAASAADLPGVDRIQTREGMRRAILTTLLAASAATFVVAQSEKLDYAMLGRIRDEGLNRSQVMDHVSWLSDVYGPRLTGSPGIQQASEWTMKKIPRVGADQRAPGAVGASAKAGRSCASPRTWSSRKFSRSSASRTSGRRRTKGAVTGEVVRVQIVERRRLREVPRQARRQDRPDAAGARRAHARRAVHPAYDGQGDRGEAETTPVPEAAAAGGGRGGQAAAAFRQKVADFYVTKASSRCSIAAATATWRPAAAILRGSSSIPTAARFSRPARRARRERRQGRAG